MRSLHRNKRDMWYALPVGKTPILDEYGNDTLEVEVVYSDAIYFPANVSANVGQEAVEVFGATTKYNRTVSIADTTCPLIEGCRVWFGVDPLTNESNYVVVRVADSKNGYLVALREVTAHV